MIVDHVIPLSGDLEILITFVVVDNRCIFIMNGVFGY